MKMVVPKKIIFLGIILILISVISLILINNRDSAATKGYKRVNGFVYHKPDANGIAVGCDASIPSCGYCPGEIINEACYVKK